jgi:hypothetical protein
VLHVIMIDRRLHLVADSQQDNMFCGVLSDVFPAEDMLTRYHECEHQFFLYASTRLIM